MQEVRLQVGDRISDLQALLDEMDWVPGMLDTSKASPGTWLTYGLMLQHDVAKISTKIRRGKFGQSENRDASLAWSRVMVPILDQVLTLQTALILDIASHDEVDNKDAAYKRLKVLYDGDGGAGSSYREWYKAHLPLQVAAQRQQLEGDLGWKNKHEKKYLRVRWSSKCILSQKGCTSAGRDICKIMGCSKTSAVSPSYSGSHNDCAGKFPGKCTPAVLDTYIDTHVADKLRSDAEMRGAFLNAADGIEPKLFDTVVSAVEPVVDRISCNFGSDLCGWTSSGTYTWRRNSGRTPSSNTGPHTGASRSNWYIYVEASHPNYPYKEFILQSPSFILNKDAAPE